MSTPAALTRRVPGTDADAATDNMRQLVQLRWLAVGGQFATVLAVRFGLGVPLPLGPMLGVIALLALANVAGTLLLPRHRVTNGEILLALLLDVGSLTAQLYFSGGVENPFVSFYLLQVVLGAILLDGRSAWVLFAVTVVSAAGLTIDAVPLAYPDGLWPAVPDLQALGSWVSFALTGGLLALFVTRITRNLRARDQHLADLRQRAIAEDGIVRMGLFASGAAHELGTPLASLAVILGDWRRLPRIAGDRELSGEVDEMLGEVQRCKNIVTTILHSAGEPRGEALGTVPVAAFLDEVVRGWHGARTLLYVHDLFGEGEVVADPALRQAIWNLLDNAIEHSPGEVMVEGERVDDMVVVTVSDRGPGFSAGQLGTIGQLHESRKGAGHGLGLFLAANVARRLGGRIEAANRPGGGAEVRLLLPVAGGGRP